jgi:hypothetical protein
VRAVWSFWSKPYLAQRSSTWATPAQHWLSWILSLETARRHLPDTALYTDSAGANLLVDRLGLEFREVSTALDDLADQDPGWWALGKLRAYELQTAPFAHIDSDVFLWKALPDRMLRADVFAQNPEYVEHYYHPQCLEDSLAAGKGTWLPIEWRWFREQGPGQYAPCCGIVGGRNVAFLRDYARKAIKMVEHRSNRRALGRFEDKPGHMILIEQYFLSACLGYRRESAEYLFESWDQATNPFHAAQLGFTHLIGSAKKDEWIARRVEARVKKEYPGLFARVPRVLAALTRGAEIPSRAPVQS